MISIAIVEDEEMYAKQLQQFLHQYEKENKEMFDITVYSDGDQIVNKYKSQYDIILLAVAVRFMGGMRAVIRGRNILIDHSFQAAVDYEYHQFSFAAGGAGIE